MNTSLLLAPLLLEVGNTGKLFAVEIVQAIMKLMPMIITATVAVCLKLIVESKKKKITFWGAFLSWVFSLGVAYISYPVILTTSSKEYVPLWLAFAVLVGEKVVMYVIDKFSVDIWINAILNTVAEKIGISKK